MTQPTESTKTTSHSSPDPAACIAFDALKEYASGWSDEAQSEHIESHLAVCSSCQQTLRELELKPDTLLQSLQRTAVEASRSAEDHVPDPLAEPVIDAALSRARALMDRPADSSKPAWQPVARELGVYELLRPLGRGGMGAVYLATHRQLNKQVAIKLLPVMSAEDSDVRARFQREIRVVGRLNHPSIVAATDAGEIDGTQFLVMEYVPGLDLSRLARLMGKLLVPDACELMRQVALGLSCAHAEGVVHRDVKPSNLMLDETGHIRILDFGLAQLSFWDEASVDLTTVGQLMGTLDYMAPEQAELSGGVDYRADLYAMGATLFRLLCGRPPLAAAPNQSPLEKLRLLASHEPPKLNTLCPEAPEALVTLMRSLLSRNPQDRPASAAHVAEQLAEFTGSADLVGLLERAREQESKSPELLRQPDISARNANSPRSVPNAELYASVGNRSRNRRWMVAVATLPLMILAGILIKLETDKGQLVIESEVDNIKVQIHSSGQSVSGLSIKQGATATRLRADKYEIVIDGPSDGLTIDNNQFTVSNGDTIVARIRHAAADGFPTESVAEETRPRSTLALPALEPLALPALEPLYEGKTLSEWLEMLPRERSPTGLKSALDACSALVSPQTSDRITQALLNVIPGLDGKQNLAPGKDTRSTLDHEAQGVLRRANPGSAYYALWVRQFEMADENWRKRLWDYALYSGESVTTLEPFVAWAELRLSQVPTGTASTDEDSVKAAGYLRGIVAQFPADPLFEERIAAALKNSPHLGTWWWLSQPLIFDNFGQGFGNGQKFWPPAIESEITKVAIETLEDTEASPSLVAQACMILANGAELDPQRRTTVLAAANRRLIAACATPAMMTEMITIDSAFLTYSAPSLSTASAISISAAFARFSVRQGETKACVVLELLDLVHELHGVAEVKEGLTAVGKETESTLKLIYGVSANRELPNPNLRSIYPGTSAIPLRWPEFTHSDVGQAAMATRQLWGKHEPTADDWLKYCMLMHPAMAESVAASVAAMAEEQSPPSP